MDHYTPEGTPVQLFYESVSHHQLCTVAEGPECVNQQSYTQERCCEFCHEYFAYHRLMILEHSKLLMGCELISQPVQFVQKICKSLPNRLG